MSWAAERRTFILIGIGLVASAALAIFAISVFHEVPTCADGKWNQDEEGVDCGGSCELLCSSTLVPPTVSFTRALVLASGRTDIIAYVENPNPSARLESAAYTIELFSAERVVLATLPGSVSIPAAGVVPIYIPGAYEGPVAVAQAFLAFDASSFVWKRGSRDADAPVVTNVSIQDTGTPRITAVVQNQRPTTLRAVPVVATVFGGEDRVIAASQTLIAELPGFGSANVVFTWTSPFTEPPTRVDLQPILP